MIEQNVTTRNLLARLDVAITKAEKQQRVALTIEADAREHAAACGKIKADLMAIRDELRPLLDSTAPREYPYDHR